MLPANRIALSITKTINSIIHCVRAVRLATVTFGLTIQEFRLKRPVDLAFGNDGSLHVLARDAWVRDEEFSPGAGSLYRIRVEPD